MAPKWADSGGIIPLTADTSEATLLDRIRGYIKAYLGDGDVTSVEQEFEDIVGRSLDLWLNVDFFKSHISQFKKRPIAWQLQSGSFTARRKPAFACLVYYHKLNGNTLTTIQSQYIRPLRQRYETELRGIEAIQIDSRSRQQDSRRLELEELIRELRDFDSTLGKVATEGFDSRALRDIAEEKPLDKWCSIDGIKSPPDSLEAFLRQEMAYIPDLNEGVRVNIAPLQKAGLLAANVLSSKDVEKAIADRAEWRTDERRWCREGRLPRPGWWPDDE